MDRQRNFDTDSVSQRIWRRYCPKCAAFTTAVAAEPHSPYEGLVQRMMRKYRLECLECGNRLNESVHVPRRRPARVPDRDAPSFLKPNDGRGAEQILEDLKEAESKRPLAASKGPSTQNHLR